MRGVAAALTTCASLVVVGAVGGQTRTPPRPEPDTYHWVLPADGVGVDVAELHPNDCYAVHRARGAAYFGEITADLREIQRQIGEPRAHRVDRSRPGADVSECDEGRCVSLVALEAGVRQAVERVAGQRSFRDVAHRPSPVDHWFGGAYTDVGSESRARFRNLPEQRMLFQHLSTSRRGNCYEAKAPRTLSIHVRDQDVDRPRAGVYSGYLYIEHHHPALVGEGLAGGEE